MGAVCYLLPDATASDFPVAKMYSNLELARKGERCGCGCVGRRSCEA